MTSSSELRHRKGKGIMGQEEEFVWDVGDERTDIDKTNAILVGRIWTSKAINARAAIDTMTKLWNPKGNVVGNLIDVKNKIFIFKFELEADKAKVVNGQPWHFDKFIWCFNDPISDGRVSDTPLFHVPFWARVYDLPLRGRSNLENIRRLGMQLGRYVGVDEAPLPEVERAVRVRVLHDVRSPLRDSVKITLAKGEKVEFEVKYEILPIFCYGCGVLGHGEKDCEDGPYEEGELRFSENLRASPRRVVKTMAEVDHSKARVLFGDFEEE
ncbi:uncharacterized protein LOC141612882 [Silene latifolia]|uniref:uncharacterized protein LOC141612882 n=1 Tax=Silene latifolia TaxID=37657 RepID=UPI003D77BF15